MGQLMRAMEKIEMPPRLGAIEQEALLDAIKAKRQSPLAVDASQLAGMSTQAVQLLLACEREWKNSNLEFSILDPSGVVAAAFERLGLSALPSVETEISV